MPEQCKKVGIGMLWILMATLSGCSSLRVEHQKTDQIRKVAIVGFSLEQTMPMTGEDVAKSIFLPKDDSPGLGHPAPLASVNKQADQVYELLRTQLMAETRWNVISLKELQASPAYQARVRASTQGFQRRPLLSKKGNQLYRPEGVAEQFWVLTLSAEERAAIAKELGVDGILSVQTNVSLENAGVISIGVAGDLRSRAVTRAALYNRIDQDAIWEDFDAAGEPTQETVEHTLGFANIEKVHTQARTAAGSSYRKLLARFEQSK